MRIATVPASVVLQARRLDANFYIGDQEEKAIEAAKASLERAEDRLRYARNALTKRDELRKTLGIVLEEK